MTGLSNLSKWMAAFWVGVTAFWVLFLAAAPSMTEFVLRAALLVMTVALYFWLIRNRPRDLADGVPTRVLWMLGALAALAVVGIFYYEGTLEKLASGILALSVIAVIADNMTGDADSELP